ncbi:MULTISPECIES: hypothetical protein [unclassified Meiothermus]|uniref:hypothetical protein n=1 Tax=unclassified Meiothermus TaxID=370471 RepID=UPI000D7C293A|nr:MULTISPECIES: hypothetical protein [unclassified Meiothermus]PZA07622.1 hypothetical protein DNA98_07200 [Meiothermus sp. Pnk-1]RYM30216.1 hypothetical protein EWH23_15590 [Meiothermus sp. PNK-Is4]
MEERDYYLMTPHQKSIVLSLPIGTTERLLHSAQEMLALLPNTKPYPEIVFELQGAGALLHPLSLLCDRLQDLLAMTGRTRFASRVTGMETAGLRLVVRGRGLAWLEVQVWRGESLEVLSYELEEEADDEGHLDALHRDG